LEQQFPDIKDHVAKHCRLLQHAEEILHPVNEKSIPVGKLLEFLVVTVIHDHMLTEDTKYFRSGHPIIRQSPPTDS